MSLPAWVLTSSPTDWLQAISAVAVALLTFRLVRVTQAYTVATKRMTEIMTREFEYRMAPLIGIEKIRTSGTGWQQATVDVKIQNLGAMPVSLREISVEYWVVDNSEVHSKAVVGTPFQLGAGDSKATTLNMDLTLFRSELQRPPTATGLLRFRLRYKAVGPSGEEVTRTTGELVY